MIEDMLAGISLPQWNTLLGIAAAVVTVIVGLVKLHKRAYLWLYLKPVAHFLKCRKSRDKAESERIFREIRPMLEQEILDTLEGYTAVMQEQRVTIAGAIAEGVEFRNYITGSIAGLHDTMAKVADAVEINSCDVKAIGERLNTQCRDIAEGCNKRIHINPTGGENDES